jgi:hypothetical protein
MSENRLNIFVSKPNETKMKIKEIRNKKKRDQEKGALAHLEPCHSSVPIEGHMRDT